MIRIPVPLACAALLAAIAPAAVADPAHAAFVAAPQPGETLLSEVIGTNVGGEGHEGIGRVDDVLFDAQGRAAAIVVEIGAFLGIGGRAVAIPVGGFEIVTTQEMMPTVTPTPTAPGATPPPGAAAPGEIPPGGLAPGAVDAGIAPPPPNVPEAQRWGWTGFVEGAIHHVRIPFTRADLEAAPEFEPLE